MVFQRRVSLLRLRLHLQAHLLHWHLCQAGDHHSLAKRAARIWAAVVEVHQRINVKAVLPAACIWPKEVYDSRARAASSAFSRFLESEKHWLRRVARDQVQDATDKAAEALGVALRQGGLFLPGLGHAWVAQPLIAAAKDLSMACGIERAFGFCMLNHQPEMLIPQLLKTSLYP